MTELDQLISAAYASQGRQEDVNRVYLAFLRTELFVPIQKKDPSLSHVDEHEPFIPLFAKVDGHFFMITFDTMERLEAWAGDKLSDIDYVELSGKEVVAGINENVFLCLNLGGQFYKEFSPDEIKRLKMIVSKIEQLNS